MKLLHTLLEAAKASDINVYYGHVKRALKKDPKFAAGKISRGAIASVVHQIAEDDPDSSIDTGAIISGVFAKYKAQFAAAAKPAPVAEGFDGEPSEKSPLSSKDRDFTPSGEEGQSAGGMGSDTDVEGGSDDEVQELKDLRTKDIGDKLTPEQQKELAELRADQGGSGDCDDDCCDDDCMDDDCPIHGKGASSDSPGMSSVPGASSAASMAGVAESAKPLFGKVKEAMKRRAAKRAGKVEKKEEEEEVPAKKKTIGRDLDESAKAERAKRLEESKTSILAGITKKDGSFLK